MLKKALISLILSPLMISLSAQAGQPSFKLGSSPSQDSAPNQGFNALTEFEVSQDAARVGPDGSSSLERDSLTYVKACFKHEDFPAKNSGGDQTWYSNDPCVFVSRDSLKSYGEGYQICLTGGDVRKNQASRALLSAVKESESNSLSGCVSVQGLLNSPSYVIARNCDKKASDYFRAAGAVIPALLNAGELPKVRASCDEGEMIPENTFYSNQQQRDENQSMRNAWAGGPGSSAASKAQSWGAVDIESSTQPQNLIRSVLFR